jgi:hypothetical protein
MNTNGNATNKLDKKVLLSTLWIIVMVNILTADILGLNIPGSEELLKTTSVSTGLSIPHLMLAGAILNELAIAMIILSRVLKYGMNRWANIIVGLFTILYIWGGAAPYPHYTFIATVETLCLLLIVWNAWKWHNPEARS